MPDLDASIVCLIST